MAQVALFFLPFLIALQACTDGFVQIEGGTRFINFNGVRGFNNSVIAVAPLSDGSNRIYVGGQFTVFNASRVNRLARLFSDGTIDTSFNLSDGFNNTIQAIAVVPETGDVYVTGDFTTVNGVLSQGLVRLNSDGSYDSGFAVPVGGLNATGLALLLRSNGNVYVSGGFTSYGGSDRSGIVRILSSGSIDPSFGTGRTLANGGVLHGVIDAGFGSDTIYVAGSFDTFNSTLTRGMARVSSDGDVDGAFGVGAGFNNTVRKIALGNGPKVYAFGAFTTFNGLSVFKAIRVRTDGNIDAVFNPGNINGTVLSALVTQAGSVERIYIGGGFTSVGAGVYNRIAHLESNGNVVASFLTGAGYSDAVRAIAGGPNDHIWVGGDYVAYDGVGANNFMRLSSDGRVDSDYQSLGTGFNNTVDRIIFNEEGDLLVSGNMDYYNGSSIQKLIRINTQGAKNALFAPDFNGRVRAMALASDGTGDIYVAGHFQSVGGTGRARLARLQSDGTLDGSFNPGTGFNDRVDALTIRSDGQIYFVGDFSTFNGTTRNKIALIDASGNLVAGFDPLGGFNALVRTVAVVPDGSGKVYAGGDFATLNAVSQNRISRVQTNGALDNTFFIGTGFSGGNVHHILPQSDGTLFVVGDFDSYGGSTFSRGAILLKSNGAVESSFNVGNGFNARVRFVAPVGDGSGDFYFAGDFTTYDGFHSRRVIRLNADGSVDSRWPENNNFSSNVRALLPLANLEGDVFVAGEFKHYNNIIADRLTLVDGEGNLQ